MPEHPFRASIWAWALESPHIYDGHIIYYSNCTILRVKAGTSNNHVSMTGINQDCPGHTKAYGHPDHIQLPLGRSSGVWYAQSWVCALLWGLISLD